MATANGIYLHEKQMEVYKAKSRFKVVVAGRRWGKSLLARTMMIKYARVPRRLVWYVAPSYRMAKDIMWPELKWALPRKWIKRINETSLEMTLINGTRVALRGADNPDSLRGVGVHFLVMDEVQDIDPEAWTKVLRPTLASTGGHVLFIGSPKSYNHLYDLYMLGQDSKNRRYHRWMSWQFPTSSSPFIPPEEIEAAKADMDEKSFNQEFCHLPDTEILTPDGNRKIVDLNIGDKVMYLQDDVPKVCSVTDFAKTGKKKIIVAELEDGSVFSASSGHKMKIHLDGIPSKVPLDDVEFIEKTPVIFRPETPEEKLAALVGYCMGDGSVTYQVPGSDKQNETTPECKTLGGIFYCETDEVWGQIASDIESLELADGTFVNLKRYRPGYKHLLTNKIHLGEKFAAKLVEAGIPVGMPTTQAFTVPEWILNGSDGVKRSYLGALFAARDDLPDTKLIKGKAGNRPVLSTWKVDGVDGTRFPADLQKLTDSFGVKTKIVTEKDRIGKVDYTVYTLVVQTDSFADFYNRISYVYNDSKAIAAWKMARYIEAYRYFMKRCAGDVLGSDDSRNLSFGKMVWLVNSKTKGKDKFPRFEEWIKTRWNEDTKTLRLSVMKKEEKEPADVYNITVDSPDHSYLLADGTNNYNCASFEMMSGRVYYSFDREVHLKNDIEFNPDLPIWIGQDFNLDPMSSVVMQLQKDGTVHIVDEIVLHGSNTEEVCEEIEKRYWRWQGNVIIFPDPAGQYGQHARGESDLDIFRERGFKRLRYHRKHPLISDRVNAVNRMLKSADGQTRLFVHPKCKGIINSLEQTVYKKGTREIDKLASVEHSADALGYCIHYQFPTKNLEIVGVSI